MEKACFSSIRKTILSYLQNAKKEVIVAMAWFTNIELFNALISCLERQVRVELVLLDDAINYMYYAPDFNQYIKEGGILRIAKSSVGFMHHKFCVIDNKYVITGSYNWTYYAETRNIENIVITDNKEIVNQFSNEFNRLSKKLSYSSSCQRLSWDDIEAREDVDFRELNYEIERICEVQKKPIRKFFEIKTEVVRRDIHKTPLSHYHIGILALDRDNIKVFDSFINADEELPYCSDKKELYFDSKNLKEFPCLFLFGDPNNRKEWHSIKEVDLMQLVNGVEDENLPITFRMSLEDNGNLKIYVACSKSGQQLTISALNSKFVKYE